MCEGAAATLRCVATDVMRIVAAEFGRRANVTTTCDTDSVESPAESCVTDAWPVLADQCTGVNTCQVRPPRNGQLPHHGVSGRVDKF